MTYKWLTIFWGIIPVLASTYGSGSYNAGNYNGTAVAAAPTVTPAPIVIGPITLPGLLPVTGAAVGALLIAAAAALGVWVYLRRRKTA